MELFPKDILDRLLANGQATKAAKTAGKPEPDHVPVVKLFSPYGVGTWLLTEADPDNPDHLYGLCDLGEPETGYVSREEMESTFIGRGVPAIERDLYWTATAPLSTYARIARTEGRIIDNLKGRNDV